MDNELEMETVRLNEDNTVEVAVQVADILKRGGVVLGLEVNEAQFAKALERVKGEGLEANFIGEIGNFKYIENLALKHNFSQVDGILFDL